jgi:hypothetical protein
MEAICRRRASPRAFWRRFLLAWSRIWAARPHSDLPRSSSYGEQYGLLIRRRRLGARTPRRASGTTATKMRTRAATRRLRRGRMEQSGTGQDRAREVDGQHCELLCAAGAEVPGFAGQKLESFRGQNSTFRSHGEDGIEAGGAGPASEVWGRNRVSSRRGWG